LYTSCFCYGANPLPSKGKKVSKPNPATTNHTIRFDKTGKIIGGYPSIIRKGDNLIFIVEDETPLGTPLKKKIDNYKAKLEKLSTPPQNNIIKKVFTCNPDFDSYKKSIKSYLPTELDRNTVYKVKITIKGSKSSKTFDCEVTYSNSGKFGTTDAISIIDDSKDYDKIEEITFQLIKTNVDNTIIKNYLDGIKDEDKFKNWDKYQEAYATHKNVILKESQEIDRLISLWELDKQVQTDRTYPSEPSVCCEYQTQLCKKLEAIKCENEAIIALTEWILKENCEWIKKWLWLTGLDNPSLNPFIVSDVSAEEIKNTVDEIAALQAQIEVLKTSFARTSIPEKESKTYKDFLAKLNTLNQEVTRASNRKASLLDYQKKYNDWLAKNTIESQLLYAGQLFVSRSEHIIWMPQFDAGYNYKLMNPDKSIPDLIAEGDAINPLAINVKRGTIVTSQETVKPFVMKTRLSEVIDEQWGNAFDSLLILAKNLGIGALEPLLNKATTPAATSSSSSLGNSVEQSTSGNTKKATAVEKEILTILQEVQKASQVLSVAEIEIILKKKMSDEASEYFEELKELAIQQSICVNNITLYAKTKSYLVWLNKQTPPILELQLEANEDTLLHTDWAQSKQKSAKKGAVEVTYSLKASDGKKTDTVVEEQVYKQYETTRFWYGVGLAYVPSPRYTSEYDVATKAFKENPEPQQLDIVVGMKWYPCKMNQMHTRERARYTAYGKEYQDPRGNAVQNRFSVFFGLGVRYKFLRNYFLGVGYDIVPGLNINAGVNAYFQRRYEFENGQLKQSYDWLKMNRGYIAITTDIAVFSRFIKLINPF
jgi:hypothetical protein